MSSLVLFRTCRLLMFFLLGLYFRDADTQTVISILKNIVVIPRKAV